MALLLARVPIVLGLPVETESAPPVNAHFPPITLENIFTGTDGAAITVANSGTGGNPADAVSGTILYDATPTLFGATSMHAILSASTTSVFRWQASFGSQSRYFVRDYFQLHTNPTAVSRIYQESVNWGLASDTAGALVIRELVGGTNKLVTGITPTKDVWHRFELFVQWNPTLAQTTVTVRLFLDSNLNGLVPDYEGTSTAFAQAAIAGNYEVGSISSAASTWDTHHTGFALSTVDWIGPRAQAITASLGLPVETETALSVKTLIRSTLGVPTETETALAAKVSTRTTLGLPFETESALTVKVVRRATLGLPTETELALPVTVLAPIRVALGLPTETETAQTLKVLTRVSLGLPTETETAQAVKVLRRASLGLATETETALAVKVLTRATLGLPTETESALPLTVVVPSVVTLPSGPPPYSIQRRGLRGAKARRIRGRRGRGRYPQGSDVRVPSGGDFVNPYPWMSSLDAMVMLELQHRHIPFSYRWFNADNPYIKQLLPGWAPEFTLKDLKVVILVYGAFFGQIPGVLQQDILGKVILEKAGWRVLTWWEYDIQSRLWQLFQQEPRLENPSVHGGQYTSPYGTPDLMTPFRALRARQRRYISSNARLLSRSPGRRIANYRGGAFVTGRRTRDVRSERQNSRRYPAFRRYPRR